MNAAPPALAFGSLLRRYRRGAGLTQEELAERAGLSARSLGNLERGVPHRPRKDTLALLAAALGLTPSERAALEEAARRLDPDATAPPAPVSDAPIPLVGRRAELAVLERHLAGEGPPLLVLAGEPGIGKTRLLQAAIPRAAGAGLRVLQGGCQRQGGQDPYAPLLGALLGYLRQRRPAQLRTALAGCAWLVRLLPELAEGPIPPLPDWALPVEQERRLMGEAVLRLLANVAGPAGTLLVLDDLHWAGADALGLLAQVVRSAGEVPLRLVGAYRDTEGGDALSTLLADLAHVGLAARRALHPLSPPQAAQLVVEVLGERLEADLAVRERVVRRTGGVPFFIVSCAQDLRERGERVAAVPWNIAQSVRQRVAAVSASAREVLGIAAIAGRPVSPRLLTAAAGCGENEVLHALESACQARLLQEVTDAEYGFAHDVIREVVEAELGAARRAVLHRRVAEALERGPGVAPVERLAHHYRHSDERGRAVPYLQQAGDQARAQYANAAAAGYYRELAACLEEVGRDRDAAAAREKLGAVLITTASYDDALTVLEEAATTYRAVGDLGRLGSVMAQVGWAQAQKGMPQEGVARLQPLLAPLEAQGPSAALVVLHVALARLFVVAGRFDEELAVAARAVELARALEDERLLAEATGRHGLALLHVGRLEESLRLLAETCWRAEGTRDAFSLCRALVHTAVVHEHRGEFGASRTYVERAMEAATRLGDPTQVACITAVRGMLAFYTGDWPRARADVEQAVAVSRPLGTSWVLVDTLIALGEVCLGSGEWDDASGYLDEAATVAAHSENTHGLWWTQCRLAERDLLQGRPADARARLLPLRERLHPQTAIAPFMLTQLAWAYLDCGELEQAETSVAQAVACARLENKRRPLVEALRVQGLVALRRQRWAEAASALEDGLTLARRMPHPYAEARLLHASGQLCTAMGDPAQARMRLAAALAILRHLGARQEAARSAHSIATLVDRIPDMPVGG